MKRIFLILAVILITGIASAGDTQYGNWTSAGPEPPFSPRAFYGSAVFSDQIFVIGGRNIDPETPGNNTLFNDVWSTSDGRNWTKLTSDAGFSPRFDLNAVVLGDKLLVVGGTDATGIKNDVWSSSDGKNWRRITADADFSPRNNPVIIVFDNKIWVIGGETERVNPVNDVWSSPDGINWTQQTGEAGFSQSHGFHLSGAVWNNRIFITGAKIDANAHGKNHVWSSGDGKTWTLVTDNASFKVMEYIPLVASDDRLWITGGGSWPWVKMPREMAVHPDKYFYFNSVWSSHDGRDWKLETDHAGFSPRYGMGVVTYQKKIWVLGGVPHADDVWYLPLDSRQGSNDTIPFTVSSIPSQVIPSTVPRSGIDPGIVFFSLIILEGVIIYRSGRKKR